MTVDAAELQTLRRRQRPGATLRLTEGSIGLGVPAELLQREASAGLQGRIVVAPRRRLVEVGEGLVMATQLALGQPTIQPRQHQRRVQPKGLPVVADGFLKAAAVSQRTGAVEVTPG